MSDLLKIVDLHASIDGKPILNGLNLTVGAGEVHAIMGPNGSGKSTLAHVVMGNPRFEVTSGDILFQGQSLLEMATHERARLGLFLTFQQPVSLSGVSLMHLVRRSTAALRSGEFDSALGLHDELEAARQRAGLAEALLWRGTNDGFSGGEKKKGEIIQLALAKPKLAMLDEIDSGLDVDALRRVGESIEALRGEGRSFVLITHYQRILSHVKPDFVHILRDGRIERSGTAELALQVESSGYGELEVAHGNG